MDRNVADGIWKASEMYTLFSSVKRWYVNEIERRDRN